MQHYQTLAISHRGGTLDLSALPITGSMLYEGVENLQVSIEHFLTAMLSTMSAVTMDLADVLMPDGERCPLSLYGFVVAPTGAGKTRVVKYVTKHLGECEQEEVEHHNKARSEWAAENSIFKAKEAGLIRKITRMASKGESSAEDECELKKLSEQRKGEPKDPRLRFDEISSDFIFPWLHKNQYPVFVCTAEARGVLNSFVARVPEKLTSVWSNEVVRIDQKASLSCVVKDSRLAMYGATQPGVMSDFMKRHGDIARDSGLLARFLMVFDDSVPRGIQHRHHPKAYEHYEVYGRRVKELRRIGVSQRENIGSERTLLKLSQDASRRIDNVRPAIAAEMYQGMRFYRIQDFAVRIPEKAIRIAGVIHLFEGFEGDISLETINVAISICLRYSDEFERLFAGPTPEEQCEQIIRCKIQDTLGKKGKYVKKNDFLQRVPRPLRGKDVLYPVLDRLVGLGLIYEFEMNRTQCINLHCSSGHNDVEARMAIFGVAI